MEFNRPLANRILSALSAAAGLRKTLLEGLNWKQIWVWYAARERNYVGLLQNFQKLTDLGGPIRPARLA
jgi:hypothetical protein